jgi:hypothetical protein
LDDEQIKLFFKNIPNIDPIDLNTNHQVDIEDSCISEASYDVTKPTN